MRKLALGFLLIVLAVHSHGAATFETTPVSRDFMTNETTAEMLTFLGIGPGAGTNMVTLSVGSLVSTNSISSGSIHITGVSTLDGDVNAGTVNSTNISIHYITGQDDQQYTWPDYPGAGLNFFTETNGVMHLFGTNEVKTLLGVGTSSGSGTTNMLWATDFGVVADGTTDSTSALTNAISSASRSNAVLLLPPGVIRTAPFSLTNLTKVDVRGAGRDLTILKLRDHPWTGGITQLINGLTFQVSNAVDHSYLHPNHGVLKIYTTNWTNISAGVQVWTDGWASNTWNTAFQQAIDGPFTRYFDWMYKRGGQIVGGNSIAYLSSTNGTNTLRTVGVHGLLAHDTVIIQNLAPEFNGGWPVDTVIDDHTVTYLQSFPTGLVVKYYGSGDWIGFTNCAYVSWRDVAFDANAPNAEGGGYTLAVRGDNTSQYLQSLTVENCAFTNSPGRCGQLQWQVPNTALGEPFTSSLYNNRPDVRIVGNRFIDWGNGNAIDINAGTHSTLIEKNYFNDGGTYGWDGIYGSCGKYGFIASIACDMIPPQAGPLWTNSWPHNVLCKDNIFEYCHSGFASYYGVVGGNDYIHNTCHFLLGHVDGTTPNSTADWTDGLRGMWWFTDDPGQGVRTRVLVADDEVSDTFAAAFANNNYCYSGYGVQQTGQTNFPDITLRSVHSDMPLVCFTDGSGGGSGRYALRATDCFFDIRNTGKSILWTGVPNPATNATYPNLTNGFAWNMNDDYTNTLYTAYGAWYDNCTFRGGQGPNGMSSANWAMQGLSNAVTLARFNNCVFEDWKFTPAQGVELTIRNSTVKVSNTNSDFIVIDSVASTNPCNVILSGIRMPLRGSAPGAVVRCAASPVPSGSLVITAENTDLTWDNSLTNSFGQIRTPGRISVGLPRAELGQVADFNGGSATNSTSPVVEISQLMNNATVGYTALQIDQTNTASAGTSYGINYKVSGVSKFYLDKAGLIVISGGLRTGNNIRIPLGSNFYWDGGSQQSCQEDGGYLLNNGYDTVTKFRIKGSPKWFTNNVATPVFITSVPAGDGVGGTVTYQIEASNGGTNVNGSGHFVYTANALGTAVLGGITDFTNAVVSNPALAATLGWTWAVNVATNNVLCLTCTATHNLSVVTNKQNIHYTIIQAATNSVITAF